MRSLQLIFGFYLFTATLVWGGSSFVVSPVRSFHKDTPNSSDPIQLTTEGRYTIFAATHPKYGHEPWVTDGTSQGTILLKNISADRSSNPDKFIAVNNFMYFYATGNGKRGLWKTNGTPARTKLISTVISNEKPTSCESAVGSRLFIFQDRTGMWNIDSATDQISLVENISCSGYSAPISDVLYFSRYTPEIGNELWRTDGSLKGTWLVKDIYPGEASSAPSGLLRFNDKIIFSADDGQHGRELWISDGTTAGTHLIKDIRKGLHSSKPMEVTVMNDVLYFSAADESHGEELWRSDGTAEGTFMVRDIMTSHRGSLPRNLYSFQSHIYFEIQGLTGAELWKTDGTNIGTVFVKQVRPEIFQDAGGILYFLGFGNSSYGLWKTDGTDSGTTLISTQYFSRTELVNGGGFLLFAAREKQTGNELWRADGAKVSLVKDISPGLQEAIPEEMIGFKNHLYFSLDQQDSGKELWKSDGTPEGTTLLKDIIPGPDGSRPHLFMATDKFLFFYIIDTDGKERLFRTDGTEDGTILLSDVIEETGFFGSSYKDSLIFITYSPIALWKSDGTPEGTVLLKTFDDIYGPLMEANGLLFFQGKERRNDPYGLELWRTDGTSTSTQMVKDILKGRYGALDYYDSLLFTLDGRTLLFTTQDYNGLFSLWKTDGTANNTEFVEPWPEPNNPVSFGVVANGSFFFSFSWLDPTFGLELWRTLGLKDTTKIVIDLYPGPDGSIPNYLTPFKNKLLAFSARRPDTGMELFVTDGTTQGTRLVKDIVPGENGSSPAELFSFQNLILFSANVPDHGRELWISDGTVNGTRIAADLMPGKLSSNPFGFTKAGNTVYFIARGPGSEKRLWKFEKQK